MVFDNKKEHKGILSPAQDAGHRQRARYGLSGGAGDHGEPREAGHVVLREGRTE